VSRVGGREGERFISPDVQRERIRAHAQALGHEIATVHQDLDLPGSHSKRPGLQRMLARVERGTVQGVIVARLDRFGRSTIDVHRNLERIRQAGGELMSAAEGVDTSTPIGRFFLAVTAAFAELELDRIRENWDTARERAVSRGVHVASRTPTGYVRAEDGRLHPDPVAAPVVAAIFAERGRGASWRELAGKLAEAGVATPYGSEHWTPRSISHILANRVYLGEARSGEHVLPGAHEPLVDEATWLAAQRPGEKATGTLGGALLSGLVRCAGCRYVLKADSMRARDGEKLRLYRCRGESASGRCPSPASVLGRVIEPWVIERFFEGLGDVLAEAVAASESHRQLETDLDSARRELATYRDSAAAEILGRDSFEAGLRARAGHVGRLERLLAEARDAAGVTDLPDAISLRETWEELEVAERRHLLSLGIDAVFLRSIGQGSSPITERALICWRGEAPEDLPGPGRRVGLRSFDWPS